MSVLAYFRLLRVDVTLIAVATYLLGVALVEPVDTPDLLVALAIALISTNFIYSLNAWSDRHVDRINKPHRPLACGAIGTQAALRYSLLLLVLSVAYPLFVARSPLTLGLFLALPLLGLLYSVRPPYLKRFPVVAAVVTSVGLVIPVQIGYYMHAESRAPLGFFAALFILCLSTVLLKDIQDAEGDVQCGLANLYVRHGRRLLHTSAAGFALVLILAALPATPPLTRYLTGSLAMVGLVWHLLGFRVPERLYERIIFAQMTVGGLFLIVLIAAA